MDVSFSGYTLEVPGNSLNYLQGLLVNTDKQSLPEVVSEPVVVHPGPASIDDLLRYVDPAPDQETEAFVSAIYADRREAPASFPGK